MTAPVEVSWFGALCDDDYELLGHHDPELLSSWEHCRTIVLAAERHGFDNVLLPSGYALGIDNTTFAAAVAVLTRRIRLLLAVRAGEQTPAALARQLASLDEITDGRLTVNMISSDVAGPSALPSAARYRRTVEVMYAVHELLAGRRVDLDGEFVQLHADPPRVAVTNARLPLTYVGGYSPEARDCAAAAADVYLLWPDTIEGVRATIDDLDRRAASVGRALSYGWRSHVIVRDTEDAARAAAARLVSRLDADEGERIRRRSLDSGSAGVAQQAELRGRADAEGYVSRHLWTGIGRARSGAGAAIVGDPDQVLAELQRLQGVGVDAFVLSGYPHVAECDLFARYVLTRLDHRPLDLVPQPVAL